MKLIAPIPPTTLDALPSVSNPEYVDCVTLLLINEPPLLIPVPLMVSAFAVVVVLPFKSKTAPALTVTLEAPRAAALPSCNVPTLIAVFPE